MLLACGFQVEPIVGHPLEQAARRRHLAVELGQQRLGDRHARLAQTGDDGYAITMTTGDPAAAATARLRCATARRSCVRPIRPDDEPLMAVFHAGLSPRSVYQRYFHITTLEQRTSQQRLALTCRVDPADGAALVAEQHGAEGTLQILALGRIRRTEPHDSAEIAVAGRRSRPGPGTGHRDDARRSSTLARGLGVRRLYGDMFADNDAMRAVVRQQRLRDPDDAG